MPKISAPSCFEGNGEDQLISWLCLMLQLQVYPFLTPVHENLLMLDQDRRLCICSSLITTSGESSDFQTLSAKSIKRCHETRNILRCTPKQRYDNACGLRSKAAGLFECLVIKDVSWTNLRTKNRFRVEISGYPHLTYMQWRCSAAESWSRLAWF